jgi:hypothetical protein
MTDDPAQMTALIKELLILNRLDNSPGAQTAIGVEQR